MIQTSDIKWGKWIANNSGNVLGRLGIFIENMDGSFYFPNYTQAVFNLYVFFQSNVDVEYDYFTLMINNQKVDSLPISIKVVENVERVSLLYYNNYLIDRHINSYFLDYNITLSNLYDFYSDFTISTFDFNWMGIDGRLDEEDQDILIGPLDSHKIIFESQEWGIRKEFIKYRGLELKIPTIEILNSFYKKDYIFLGFEEKDSELIDKEKSYWTIDINKDYFIIYNILDDYLQKNNTDFIFSSLYEKIYYTIIFDGNGGLSENNKPQEIIKNFNKEENNQIPQFTRDNYYFKGWSYSSSELAETFPSNLIKTPTEDLILYAQWINTEQIEIVYNINDYTVTDTCLKNSLYTIRDMKDINKNLANNFKDWIFIDADVQPDTISFVVPAGRMRGDIDGDGEITELDKNILQAHCAHHKLITDEIQLLCADIDKDGKVTMFDSTILTRIVSTNEDWDAYRAGMGGDVLDSWMTNSNYETEEMQFYTDIVVQNIAVGNVIKIISSEDYENEFFKVKIIDNNKVRVYAKLCPIKNIELRCEIYPYYHFLANSTIIPNKNMLLEPIYNESINYFVEYYTSDGKTLIQTIEFHLGDTVHDITDYTKWSLIQDDNNINYIKGDLLPNNNIKLYGVTESIVNVKYYYGNFNELDNTFNFNHKEEQVYFNEHKNLHFLMSKCPREVITIDNTLYYFQFWTDNLEWAKKSITGNKTWDWSNKIIDDKGKEILHWQNENVSIYLNSLYYNIAVVSNENVKLYAVYKKESPRTNHNIIFENTKNKEVVLVAEDFLEGLDNENNNFYKKGLFFNDGNVLANSFNEISEINNNIFHIEDGKVSFNQFKQEKGLTSQYIELSIIDSQGETNYLSFDGGEEGDNDDIILNL